MAINYSFTFNSDIITQTVKIKDGSSVDDYIIGVHGAVHATDDSDNTTITRPAIFKGTDASQKEKGEFVALSDLKDVPDGVKAFAETMITDETLRSQMAEDIMNKKTAPTSKVAPW